MAKLQLQDGLKPETVEFINTVVKELKKNGQTNVDNYILRVLASSYNTFLQCEELIITDGIFQIVNGVNKNQPWVENARKQRAQTLEILDKLNLTPKARVKLDKNKTEEETESPLLSFIQGN